MLKIQSITDLGRQRKINQDFVWTDPNLNLAILADGMGGYQYGEQASRVVAESVGLFFSQLSREVEEDPGVILGRAVAKAQEALNQAYLSLHDNTVVIGSTLDFVWWYRSRLYVAHVGDGRFYSLQTFYDYENHRRVIRPYLLTNDHNFETHIRRKKLQLPPQIHSLDQLAPNQKRMLTNTILSPARFQLETEWWFYDAPVGSLFLLCCDGLYNFVPEADMIAIFNHYPQNEWLTQLVQKANEKGGGDNISAILIQVGDPVVGPLDLPPLSAADSYWFFLTVKNELIGPVASESFVGLSPRSLISFRGPQSLYWVDFPSTINWDFLTQHPQFTFLLGVENLVKGKLKPDWVTTTDFLKPESQVIKIWLTPALLIFGGFCLFLSAFLFWIKHFL